MLIVVPFGVLRPRSHVDGEIGELLFSELMIRRGWLVTKLTPDYGFDFLGQPVENDVVTTNFVLFQVKSHARTLKVRRDGARSLRLAAAYIDFWRGLPVPAFLVAAELPTGRIFVTNCQHVASTKPPSPRRTMTVNFDSSSELTVEHDLRIRKALHSYWNEWRSVSASAMAAMIGAMVGFVPGPVGAIVGAVLGAKLGSIDRAPHVPYTAIPREVASFRSWLREYVAHAGGGA